MRRLAPLALLLVAGCGVSPGAGEDCTAIGARVGVGVDVAPRPAGPEADAATLEACWADTCRTYPVDLFPSTRAGGTTCTGDAPDDVCSAEAVETGGRHGFADIPDLPEQPVRVTLTVTADGGEQIARQTLEITPEPVYPNGPRCGAGGPQASLTVDRAGAVRES